LSAPEVVDQRLLNQLTVLTSQRNIRILDARPRIPGLLWAGLLLGAVVLVGLMGFTRLESNRGRMILSSAVAVLLGLLMFIVFWLDHPFGQELGVTPAPFGYAVLVFDGVDRGT
jgi:peptidoglycan/LPS O-acetylase OafA/YrhL